MGFFSEIASEARRSGRRGAPPQSAAPEPLEQQPTSPPEQVPAPAAPEPAPAPPKPDPAPELKLDTAQDAVPAPDDTAARQKHEAAEAKRKAEWEAKQAERKAARQAQLDKIAAMNNAELLAASVERVAADTERLTRRNMKESVAKHIQAKCREDAAFALLVMDPQKSMANCFRYITRRAREYAEQEMKDNGEERTGVYGLDVPDGLCFQWAEDYFQDENAEEDHKNDEKFVPKPYVPTTRKAAKGKAEKKPATAAKPEAEKPKDAGMEQISLM